MVEHWTFNPQVLGSNPNIPNSKNDRIKRNLKYYNDLIFYWNNWFSFKSKKYTNYNNVYRTYVISC